MTKNTLIMLLAFALVAVACGDDDTATDASTDMMTGDGNTTPDSDSPDMTSTPDATPPEECKIAPIAAPAPAGCPDVASRTMVSVDADITTDTTWTCDNLYVLNSAIYITSDATLTIEPGTVVQGGAGANALIVTTEGQIDAQGTSVDPIIFTSSKAEGSRAPGDWGGVVLLGNAPINVTGGSNNIEGLDPGEARGEYGGTDSAHDCGTLTYVRIEFAGFVFGEDNELNGLTVGGCGSDTELDYIQVHLGLDDGIEFFGGTTNMKHALVTGAGDDALDWDQGFSGNIQFFVAQQDNAGNRTIEADNLKDNNDATPRSNPTIWNATLIGAGQPDQAAMRLRRGTAGDLNNIVMMGFASENCIKVDGSASTLQANSGDLALKTSIYSGCGDDTLVELSLDEGDTATEITADWSSNMNVDPMLADPTNLDAPNFLPAADSPVAAGGTPSGAFFDADATFIGAMEPGCWDWTNGWTATPAD